MQVQGQLNAKKVCSSEENQFDVGIVGSGISGSILAAILAKHNVRVLLIDADSHPKFAIGESTVPHTSKMLELMGDRYGVPELKNLATFQDIRQKVTSSCGIKLGFGFVYHRQEEDQNPQQVTQTLIPGQPENHWYRQDIDSYMFHTAIRYGTECRQKTKIIDINIDEQGVDLKTEKGEKFRVKYLVDGSGYRSPLAQKFDLRETPTRMKTHSRTVFTHMVGVKPYEDCVHPKNVLDQPVSWSQCTLHHIFDGGWMWVIPFNNHKDATNPLCSVGLCLDSRRFPKNDTPPEAEWKQFLARFPSIAKQFEEAKLVRSWTSTSRLQYSVKKCVGDRYCLTSHAAGFIDALFSRGLANTTAIIDALANRILQAVADNDFSTEHFEYIEQLQQNTINYNDQLVNCSYISFRDFELWNAWFRMWYLAVGLGGLRLGMMHKKFIQTGDYSVLPDAHEPLGLFNIDPKNEEFRKLWDAAVALVESVDTGETAPKDAAQKIMIMLDSADFLPPALRLSDPSKRYIDFKTDDINLHFLSWKTFSTSPEMEAIYSI